MKRLLFFFVFVLLSQGLAAQVLTPEELAKRAKRKNLTVKEWNTDSNAKTKWLDHLTVYDDQGNFTTCQTLTRGL